MSIEESYEIQREYPEKIRKEIASMLSIFRFEAEISKKIKGRSGIMHKIDIFANKKAPSPIRLAIKCKFIWEETFLRVDEVLHFWAQLFDASADRGVIITTCKVSESAARFAKHHRITIISGRKYDELKYKILNSEILSEPTFPKISS